MLHATRTTGADLSSMKRAMRRENNAKAARKFRIRKREEELELRKRHELLITEMPVLKRKITHLRHELGLLVSDSMSDAQRKLKEEALKRENHFLVDEIEKAKKIRKSCLNFISQMEVLTNSSIQEELFNKNYYFIVQNILNIVEDKQLLTTTPVKVELESILQRKMQKLKERLMKHNSNSVFIDFIKSRQNKKNPFGDVEVRTFSDPLSGETCARIDILDLEVPFNELKTLLTEIESNTDWVLHLFYTLVDFNEKAHLSPLETYFEGDTSNRSRLHKLNEIERGVEIFGLVVQADLEIRADCFPTPSVGQTTTFIMGESFMPERNSNLGILEDHGYRTVNGKIIRKGSRDDLSCFTMIMTSKSPTNEKTEGNETYHIDKFHRSMVYKFMNGTAGLKEITVIKTFTLELIKYLYDTGATLKPRS